MMNAYRVKLIKEVIDSATPEDIFFRCGVCYVLAKPSAQGSPAHYELIKKVREALKTNEWDQVGDFIGRWW